MSYQVENAYRDATHPDAHHHVAELRHGGIGQNAFDVFLRHGNQRSKDRSQGADPGHYLKRAAGNAHERIHTRYQVHARGHHGCRVNQGAYRRGAFHRIRKPDVKRQLARFANRSAEDQQRNAGCNARGQLGESGLLHASRAVIIKQQRARLSVEPHHSQQQAKVPHPRGKERLFCRCSRRRPFIPEPNQQVRRQPHNLPTHKQQQQAVGDQQAEHRPGKQREEAEKPREVFVVVHIGRAVNKNQQPHEASPSPA